MGVKIGKKMYTKLLKIQRQLRKNMPSPEQILWFQIRKEQLGIKFRRQYAIENRIFDFYAPKIKLAIELDGDSHFLSLEDREKELVQDQHLHKKYGIKTLRFIKPEVINNFTGVLETIQSNIPLPGPPPLQEGGSVKGTQL